MERNDVRLEEKVEKTLEANMIKSVKLLKRRVINSSKLSTPRSFSISIT